MNLLPKWKLTGGLPASVDHESATAMEQTYKVYKAMQDLIVEYNKFADDVNKKIVEHNEKYEEDWETYQVSFRQEFQDFIDVIELKITDIETQIKNIDTEEFDLTEINNAIDEINKKVEEIEKIVLSKNILEDVKWWMGFYYGGGNKETNVSNCNFYTGTSNSVAVKPGDIYTITYIIPSNCVSDKWFALNLFDASNVFVNRDTNVLTEYIISDNKAIYTKQYTIPAGIYNLQISARAFTKGTQMIPDENANDDDVAILSNMVFCGTISTLDYLFEEVSNQKTSNVNPNVKAINHRGYNTLAPENTLAAFKLSKKNGFDYVECDIAFTSDGEIVLLHDQTIDRTSNGTGKITELTFDSVRTLDFGSWFSIDYVGEKILTFKEFLLLCKHMGLHPYIEIKYENMIEDTRVNQIVDMVNRCGMRGKVTYISFGSGYLNMVKNIDNKARLGLICNSITEDIINRANGLKTDFNEVFIDASYNDVTDDKCEMCITNNLPLEVWTINSQTTLENLNDYISGYTSDKLKANEIFMNKYL